MTKAYRDSVHTLKQCAMIVAYHDLNASSIVAREVDIGLEQGDAG